MKLFLCPSGLGLPGALSIRVVRTCVRPTEDQVKIFGPGRISRPINGSKLIFHMRIYLWEEQEYTRAMTSWPIFHGPLTLVKIFGPGRISRPVSSSKLIFHTWLYFYEMSRNLQEPSPCDLYFMVHWFRLRFLAQVDSQNLLVVESSFFTWGYISMRGAGMISWPIFHSPLTSDFGQFSKVKFFVQGRIWSPISVSKLIFFKDVSLWGQQKYTRDMTSWPIFHGPLTSNFGHIIKVKIFFSVVVCWSLSWKCLWMQQG